jgi:hypothetical protein
VAVASWAIEEAIPFYMFGWTTYCNMFKPFNKKADQVTKIDRWDIREEVMNHGRYAELLEMKECEIVSTTGHWWSK